MISGDSGTSGQVLTSTGTGIEWADTAVGFTNINENNEGNPSSPNVVLGPATPNTEVSGFPFIHANTSLKIHKNLQFAPATQIVCYNNDGELTWNQNGKILAGTSGGLQWIDYINKFSLVYDTGGTNPNFYPHALIDHNTYLGIRAGQGIAIYNDQTTDFERGTPGQVLTSKGNNGIEWADTAVGFNNISEDSSGNITIGASPAPDSTSTTRINNMLHIYANVTIEGGSLIVCKQRNGDETSGNVLGQTIIAQNAFGDYKWDYPFGIEPTKLTYANSSITFDENITLNTSKTLNITSGGGAGESGQVLTSKGINGIEWTTPASGYNNITEDNDGIITIGPSDPDVSPQINLNSQVYVEQGLIFRENSILAIKKDDDNGFYYHTDGKVLMGDSSMKIIWDYPFGIAPTYLSFSTADTSIDFNTHITLKNNKKITITDGGNAGTAGQVLTSTGTGIEWSAPLGIPDGYIGFSDANNEVFVSSDVDRFHLETGVDLYLDGNNGIYVLQNGSYTSGDDGQMLKSDGNGKVKWDDIFTFNHSDDRIKLNEELILDATNTLLKLRPQTYDKKEYLDSKDEDAKKESGLIAQEIYYLAPELRHIIVIPPDATKIDENIPENIDDILNDPDYSNWGSSLAGVKYDQLIPYIIKGFQEHNTEINNLKNKNTELENKNIELQNTVNELSSIIDKLKNSNSFDDFKTKL